MSECHLSLLFCGPRCCCSGFITLNKRLSSVSSSLGCCGSDGCLQLLCPSHTEPSLPDGRCSSSLCSVLQTSQQSLLSDHAISHLSAASRHCGLGSSVQPCGRGKPRGCHRSEVTRGLSEQGAGKSKKE